MQSPHHGRVSPFCKEPASGWPSIEVASHAAKQGPLEAYGSNISTCDDPGQFRIGTAPIDTELVALPHPSQASALPSPAAFEDAPVVVTTDPRCQSQVVETDSMGRVPMNVAFAMESELFVGQMRNTMRGYPGTPDKDLQGSKVLGRSIIQGRFKRPTRAKDVWVGQELLNKPLVPTSFQRLLFTSAAKLFSSTYRVAVVGEGESGAGYMNPLLAVAEVVNVSAPGREPDMADVHEDVRLLDSSCADRAGQPWSSRQRQRHFDKPQHQADLVFDTTHVYTFVLSQAIVDMPSYRLRMGGLLNLDLCPILNGQPLQYMCKNVRDNTMVLCLLVWHKNLNYASCPRRASRASNSSGHGSTLTPNSSLASSSSSSMLSSHYWGIGTCSSIDSCSSSTSSLSALDACCSVGTGTSSSSSSSSSSCGGSEEADDSSDAASEYASCASEFGDAPAQEAGCECGCDCGCSGTPLGDDISDCETANSSCGSDVSASAVSVTVLSHHNEGAALAAAAAGAGTGGGAKRSSSGGAKDAAVRPALRARVAAAVNRVKARCRAATSRSSCLRPSARG